MENRAACCVARVRLTLHSSTRTENLPPQLLQGEAAQTRLSLRTTFVERDTLLSAQRPRLAMTDNTRPDGVAPSLAAATTPTLVVAGNDKDAVDYYKLPSDSPIVKSFKFIDFEGAADHVRVDRSALLGAILSASWPSPNSTSAGTNDLTVMHTLNFGEYEVKTSTVKRILHEFILSGVFSTVYTTLTDWEEAIPRVIEGLQNPDALSVKAGDFDRSDWLDRVQGNRAGQVSAANAYSCPDLLEPTFKIPIGRLYILGKDLAAPGWVLARMTALMGQKSRHKLDRAVEDSHVRGAAEMLSSIAHERIGGQTISTSLLRKHIPEMLPDLVLPKMLRSAMLTPAIVLAETQDAAAYSKGDANSRWAIEIRRLTNAGHFYPRIRTFLPMFPSPSDAAVAIGRLVAELCPSVKGLPLAVQLQALEPELESRADFVASVINSSAGTPTGAELTHAIISENLLATSGSGKGGGPGSGSESIPGALDLSDAMPVRVGTLKDETIRISLHSEAFVSGVEAMKSAPTGRQVVEAGLLSRAPLLYRATLLGEPWLISRSTAFSPLTTARNTMTNYVERALTIDPNNDSVPDRLARFRFPLAEVKKVIKGEFEKINFVNGTSGFLALLEVVHGCKYHAVSEADVFTVEAAIRGIRSHGRRLFASFGFSPDRSDFGYTFADLCDKQLEVTNFARTLPPEEQEVWMPWASGEFKQALVDAGLHFATKLYTADTNDEDSIIDEFLPYEANYFTNTAVRMKQSEPFFELRTAFPTLMSGKSIYLPGTTQPGGANKRSERDSDLTSSDRDKAAKGKGKDKKKAPGDKSSKDKDAAGPGSKAHYCSWVTKDKTLFIAGMCIEVGDLAKDKGIAVGDKCWPVILSKREGKEALALCPDHAAHGNMGAPCHQRFKGFKLSEIYSKYGRKATNSESQAAGWRDSKKPKA